jgi:hypothetical protein
MDRRHPPNVSECCPMGREGNRAQKPSATPCQGDVGPRLNPNGSCAAKFASKPPGGDCTLTDCKGTPSRVAAKFVAPSTLARLLDIPNGCPTAAICCLTPKLHEPA